LVRHHSNPHDKIKIKIPLLIPNLSVAEEEKKANAIMIDTGIPEADLEPVIPFCEKTLKCGHSCKGVSNERKCLPCLNVDCAKTSGLFQGINEDELCGICYTSELGSEACSKLSCGHIFHTNCLVSLLEHKWPTLRITFGFMACPSCNQEIKLEGLSKPIANKLGPLISMKKRVERDAYINAEA